MFQPNDLSKRFDRPTTRLAFMASLLIAWATPLSAEILFYSFNEAGTQALATGSGATGGNPVLNLLGNGGAPADLHSADALGVSGLAGDFAFDNTVSSGIIGAAHAQHAADVDSIDALAAFTLAGWFRLPTSATESLGRQAAIIENGPVSVLDEPAGYRLRGGAAANSGTLELRVNRDQIIESSNAYSEIGDWVYFAVSYDGNASSSNVKFYKGTTTTPVSLVDTLSLDAGPVLQDAIPLTLGVTQTSGLTLGSFNGLLDNVRIYGQVESLSTLEAARRNDVLGVPEPSSFVLVGIGIALLHQHRRRSFRRAGCL